MGRRSMLVTIAGWACELSVPDYSPETVLEIGNFLCKHIRTASEVAYSTGNDPDSSYLDEMYEDIHVGIGNIADDLEDEREAKIAVAEKEIFGGI